MTGSIENYQDILYKISEECYFGWKPGEEEMCVDGWLTADQLIAVGNLMKKENIKCIKKI